MCAVAIVNQDHQARADMELLNARCMKVRTSGSCLPDVILSRAACTVAFVLLPADSDLKSEKPR